MSVSTTPFTYLGHAIVVPVRIDDALDARFILDTGIGLNLVSKSLCDRLACRTSGEVKGKRMSGQELTIPLTRLRSLAVGERRAEVVPAGVWDTSGLPAAFGAIDGFLSLTFFETTPFTIDYPRQALVLESPASLRERAQRGAAVPVRLDREGGTLTLFTPLDVSVGEPALVEVDTGSDALILNLPYMQRLGVDPAGSDVKTLKGKDETQHDYVRHLTRLRSPIFPPAAPQMRLEASPVMFQSIIYDGLVGHSYFKNFVVTYDLASARMILAKP